MSDHPNVKTVNEMTSAIFDQDHDTLAKIFTDDLVFHLRGPDPMAGDHAGLGGFLGVVGSWFEATNGQIELDQQFCIGDRRLGRRVGTRHAGSQRQDPRVAQRLRVPVRRRSDRRDVDVPRRAARRGRGVLRLIAADRWTRLDDVVHAIEDARAACDDHRWGDAWRLLVDARARAPRRRRSRPARQRPPTSPATTRRASPTGCAPTRSASPTAPCTGRRTSEGSSPRARVQRRPRPLPRLGRSHRPAPGRGGHRLRRAGLPRIRARR